MRSVNVQVFAAVAERVSRAEPTETATAAATTPTPATAETPQVGEVIRRLRMRRGLSMRALADEAGISASFLGAVERGESDIALGRLALVAEALDSDVASLLGYA